MTERIGEAGPRQESALKGALDSASELPMGGGHVTIAATTRSGGVLASGHQASP